MSSWKKVLTENPIEDDLASDSPAVGDVLTASGTGSGIPVWSSPLYTVDGLTDTNLTSTADGAMLLYDTGNAEWIDNIMSGDATMLDTGAVTIANEAVSLAKMANMATDSFIGRDTASSGVPEVMSASTARGVLGVESGATADQTADEIGVLFAADNTTVQFGGAVIVDGSLTVSGTTTTINTATLTVEDKLIKLADVDTPTKSTADGAGIQVEASATEADWPEIKWNKDQGGGNTDGTGTADGLTGWAISNMHTSNPVDIPIAVMEFKSTTGIASGVLTVDTFVQDTTIVGADDGTYTNVATTKTGGNGDNALTVDVVIASGVITGITIGNNDGDSYAVDDTITISGLAAAGASNANDDGTFDIATISYPVSGGIGSLLWNSSDDILYIRTA